MLPLCIGKATRLFDYIIDKTKTYLAEIQLGVETDTQDATGQVVAQCEVNVGERELREAAKQFVGEIEQIPPMYSALKRDGKRLYQLARKGEAVALEPRPCRVDGIAVGERTGEHRYRLRVDCGKGVYIRTLCHDIGRALGCGAHMASLQRTAAGVFRIEDALTREEIEPAEREGAAGTGADTRWTRRWNLKAVDARGARARWSTAIRCARTGWTRRLTPARPCAALSERGVCGDRRGPRGRLSALPRDAVGKVRRFGRMGLR